MEFSVEKATSVKKRENKKLRDIMIEKENLHIEESISHKEFLRLYNLYGKDFTEKEFAEIFLDIKGCDLHHFKEGGNRKILKNEKVDDIEICLMKLKLIKKLNLEKEQEMYYSEMEETYNSISNKLNIITFCEKVLDVLRDDVARIKSDGTRRKILKRTDDEYFSHKSEFELEKYIKSSVSEKNNLKSNLRDTIAIDMNLHMGDRITKDKFNELYAIYGENNFSQFDFAKEILGMTESKAKKLIDDKIGDAPIWKDEILELDYLLKIREETIFDENLHIRDEISYKKFKQIYKKHSGILSERDFAAEILDIAKPSFDKLKREELKRQMNESECKRKEFKCKILSDIEIPEEFYQETKKQILEKENVYFGKLISYKEFQELYKKYGFITNEIEFAKVVLEIKGNFSEFRDTPGKTKQIFVDSKRVNYETDIIEYTKEQIEKLREIVIKENKLHIEDYMSGKQFLDIYNKYGSGMSQKTFASKILDISDTRLSDIVNDYMNRKTNGILEGNEDKTVILKNEVVTNKEIKHMRKVIFNAREHSKDDLIDYKEFKRLYDLYGGKLSEKQFAEKVIFIPEDRLYYIRGEKPSNKKTAIFNTLKISDEYIANLKAQVIRKNLLFFRQRITPKFLNKLYKEVSTILSKPKFAEEILEINRDRYYVLIDSKRSSWCEILGVSGSMENREKFFKKRDKTIVQMLRDGAGYNDIEEEVNITHKDLLKKTENLFNSELDKDEIARKHAYFSILTGREIDLELAGDINLEEIKKQVETDKKFFALENKCIKILDKFLERKDDKENIMNYIKQCKKRYILKLSKMPKKTLAFLQEALEYAECDKVNLEDSLFFIKACIEHMDYKRANSYITFNMQNDNITIDEKRKLQEFRKLLRQASQKSEKVLKRPQKKKERSIA